MKHILFVTDTYYPDSSATTTLGRRTAEALAQLGYSVDVYPAEISGNHFSYQDEYNGVRIIRPDEASEMNYAPVNPSESRSIEESDVAKLRKVLDGSDYDCVFSVALAFEVNFLAHRALSTLTSQLSTKWFPMSYDPYAFNPHITAEQRKIYIQQEVDALKDATRIFFLTEFGQDYIGSPIENRIVYFNLPCIRKIDPDRAKRVVEFDGSYINCVFLGDFYYGVENTDFIFRLFDKLCGNIRLYTIGSLCDYKPTVDMWQKKMGGRYICHERISQEEAHNVMLDCDVLVSMGHDSANMCPSKVIDFISSGKPILHIMKIQDCCAEKYLRKYPDKYCIYQGDELTDQRVNEVEQFILSSKGRLSLPFGTVKELYNDFTMEALVEKILKEINVK